MTRTQCSVRRPCLIALGLYAVASSAPAQIPVLDSLVAAEEARCRRPFVRPPELPLAALGATAELQLSPTTTVRLTAEATNDFRPPVDPGFSILPPLRCRPHAPLELILYLRPTNSATTVSSIEVDSVWIARGPQHYATAPVRTVVDSHTDTLITCRIYRGPLWIKDTIDVFVRLKAPSHQWLAIRHITVDLRK